MEALVVLLVVLSPWAFGCVEPFFEFCLYLGVGLLVLLWVFRVLQHWEVRWQNCAVILTLGGLFTLGVVQLLPLPPALLQVVSPETSRLYQQLLPAQAEVLADGETATPPADRGQTISLYPGATRLHMLRLLALMILFAVVRNNIASAASLKRLALFAMVNGVALSLFALIQHFSSPRNQLYWTFTAPAEVFGPFICRNHFSFYVNICIGLGIGLVLYHQRQLDESQARSASSYFQVLEEPVLLWLVAGLAFMVSSILVSRSRGGVVALLVSAALIAALRLYRRGSWSRIDVPLLLGAVTLALLAWFGFESIDKRLSTLWDGQALQESRAPLWSMLFPLVQQFPLLGTGWGTFPYVEVLPRTSADDVGVLYEHAHNEYLEAWIEGGLVGLLLVVFAGVLLLRYSYLAYVRNETRPTGGLVLGALLGLCTVLIHSVGDFGLHIPAIAVLAAVVAAQLSYLGSQPNRESPPPEYRLRLGGVAPILAAVFGILLALVLLLEGWRMNRVHRLRMEAYAWLNSDRPDRLGQALARFALAAQLAPELARLQLETGQAYLEYAEDRTTREELQGQLAATSPWFTAPVPATFPHGPIAILLPPAASDLLTNLAWQPAIESAEQKQIQPLINTGARHLARARDLCPVFGAPQVRLAAARSAFRQADPAIKYLERAQLLVPADPELWYLGGIEAVLQNDREQAARQWKRSLECSDRFLPEILDRSAVLFGPREAAALVVPDQPELLLAAAERLFPAPDMVDRLPIYRRALALYASKEAGLEPPDLEIKARLQYALDQKPEAIQTLRQAIQRRPSQAAWRMQLANWLAADKRFKEAREEVQMVLVLQPGNHEALKLEAQLTELMLRND